MSTSNYSVIAENAVWYFRGELGGIAGSHSGHQEILAFLMRVSELTNGTLNLDLSISKNIAMDIVKKMLDRV